MKKSSLLRKTMSLAGSAVLLAGLLTGFHGNHSGIFAVSAKAASSVTAGSYYQVDANMLNIRQGPGFQYGCKGGLTDGSLVKVLETRGSWARINDGWVNIDYLKSAGKVERPASADTSYVRVPALNIRRGPGTQYAVCGQVMEGYKVAILETQNGWGRIKEGWISLEYVGRTGPAKADPPVNNANAYANTTVKVTATNLNVRQGPGTSYRKVGSLANGTKVTISEVRNGWGMIKEGWISLNYVRAADGSDGYVRPSSSGSVEVTVENLRIRTGPGENYASCGMLTKGYRASVSDVQDGWAKIDGGWISLDYARWIR